MKQYTVYVCETCGYESKSFDDMEEHEASHLGLTVTEMDEYRALKFFVNYKRSITYLRNNEDTRRDFDSAVEQLVAFEKAHGIVKE